MNRNFIFIYSAVNYTEAQIMPVNTRIINGLKCSCFLHPFMKQICLNEHYENKSFRKKKHFPVGINSSIILHENYTRDEQDMKVTKC